MQPGILSVSEINEYVRRSLAGDPMLQGIAIRGEISNFKRHTAGHYYFSLKDENSRISCVMFRQYSQMVRFLPKDGTRVVLSGYVGLYTTTGSYQFYGEAMAADGVGSLYEEFLRVKERMQKEGLFDVTLKKTLPLLPAGIGILTAKTGAVLYDIINVGMRRFPRIPFVLRAAMVQGTGAAEELAVGLAELDRLDNIDVIIVARGGGSLEDLWAFNEEILIRAVANCKKPVISAVGHETDITLTDLVADVRAPTPSAAAEIAVPLRVELERKIFYSLQRFVLQTRKMLDHKLAKIDKAEAKLVKNNPLQRIRDAMAKNELLLLRIHAAAMATFESKKTLCLSVIQQLKSSGPQNSLNRGYVIVLSEKGKPIQSVRQVSKQMTLHFRDGQAEVQTIKTTMEDDKYNV